MRDRNIYSQGLTPKRQTPKRFITSQRGSSLIALQDGIINGERRRFRQGIGRVSLDGR